MLRNKHIDTVCVLVIILAVVAASLFTHGEKLGLEKSTDTPGYSTRLFEDSYVHNIDLRVDDWDSFISNAGKEEYISCDIVIDGEKIRDAGLRVKGNNSKALVEKYDAGRYSLKIEIDHYNDGANYYGLDKFNLDASFQDNSYLKNYMTYGMMSFMGVPSPLCSYTWVTVNGEDLGLYLAVEEPEEAFLKRNFGKNHGKLYKPDYKDVYAENKDVALQYIDDDPESYDNIFRKAKTDISYADKKRLISSLKSLHNSENLDKVIDIDEIMRYFAVQVFVVNLDSYLGPTGHNYFLYEEDGQLSILPWDYNLAYCTYSLGMPEPVNDARLYVNYPVDTPAWGEVMIERPLFHNMMQESEYYELYHDYFSYFISGYFESGYFEQKAVSTRKMIAPYVKKDPTAYCSYDDFILGTDTFIAFCKLRAESVRKQLDGIIPSTIKGQSHDDSNFVDASSVWLPDLGEVDDLRD